MIRVPFPLFLKSTAEQVRGHVRAGIRVLPYSRTGKPQMAVKRRSTSLRATYEQMLVINDTIESNMGFLIYMGKQVAGVHGLDAHFDEGQPTGDLADLVAEGKHGMLIGGMEALKNNKVGDMRLQQMKTRAKQRMRATAKELRDSVKLPRDIIKQLAIIYATTERFMKANSGEKPSAETLAEMVILHRRTREGKPVVMEHEEKVARIEALSEYRGAQYVEDLSINPHVEEADVTFWTNWSREERQLRETTHKIINRLVEEEALSKDEQEVLYLRFYVDKPQFSRGMGTRSFESIARTFDERRGLKKLKVRKKVGETHRFRPWRKVKVEKVVQVRNKFKVGGKWKYHNERRVTYKRAQHKAQISGIINSIGPKSFVVKRPNGTTFRIRGKPPFKNLTTNPMDVFDLYHSGVEKIMSHPTAPDQLKAALAELQKSFRIVILI